MVPFNQIQKGDYLVGEFEGKHWKGEVTRLNTDEKQVCLDTGVQEFWFTPDHLYCIPLNDESLSWLNFQKELMSDGAVKYKKGSFRILLPKEGDFKHMDIWYREDKRHQPGIEFIHQLQNHYYQMTKVHLTDEVMV